MKKKIKLLVAFIITICLWQIISVSISKKYDVNIILPPPVEVLKKLLEIIKGKNFSETLLFSLGRIVLGFLSGVVLGTGLGIISGKWENIEILLKPIMSVIKAVPVASFVVLSLIWFGSERLSVFIAFLMVMPVIYTNVLQGVKSIDVKMLQMASIYKMTFLRRLKYLWLPSVKPFFISGSKVASGLAWKSGIAAELIGIPEGSVGEMLYESKIYFDTSTLLAWTAIIVSASIVTEKLFIILVRYFWNFVEKDAHCFSVCSVEGEKKRNLSIRKKCNGIHLCGVKATGKMRKKISGKEREPIDEKPCSAIKENSNSSPAFFVSLFNVEKKFGDEVVISDFSYNFDSGVTAILGKSGGGKTTLLNIILGIEQADSGKIETNASNMSVVFQEDRLSENFTPVANIEAVTGTMVSREKIEALLRRMGLGDSLKKKGSELSGGMKRRTSIARALLFDGDILVMDEPFKGLDDETKDGIIEIVKEYARDKTVIFVTHDEDEISAMDCEKILEISKEGGGLLNLQEKNSFYDFHEEIRAQKQKLRNEKQRKREKTFIVAESESEIGKCTNKK